MKHTLPYFLRVLLSQNGMDYDGTLDLSGEYDRVEESMGIPPSATFVGDRTEFHWGISKLPSLKILVPGSIIGPQIRLHRRFQRLLNKS